MTDQRKVRILVCGAFCALALAACGSKPNPPQPKTEAPAPAPMAKASPASAPVAAAPAPSPQPAPDPNAELASKVKSALEGHKLVAAGIDVSAADGKVTLWGTVASKAERSRAGKLASAVEGVRSVDNRLQIVKGS